jgi:transposase
VTHGGKRATEVARDLGIHVNLIYNWQKQLLEDSEYSFPGHGKLKPGDEELRRLKRKLADVEEERDILKKALAIFSKRPR